jgi:hypothetical protein
MVGLSREDIIGLYSRNKDIFHSNKLKESLKAMETIKIKSYLDIPSKFTGIAEFLSGTKIWYKEGKLHRLDGPAAEYKNGKKEWYKEGRNHRLDGPAIEEPDGTKIWYKEGKLHRLDGPAIELENGTKTWYIDGVLYSEKNFNKKVQEINESKAPKLEILKLKLKETLPPGFTGIVEISNGTKFWLVNGLPHRLDGPAVELVSGEQNWYKEEKLHRLDGPAVIYPDGSKEFWIEGKWYSEEEDFNKKVQEINQLKESKMETIKIKSYLDLPKNFTGIAEYPNKDKCWYKEGSFHRDDGPAVEFQNGTKSWYKEGKLHRLDGAAIEFNNGAKEWWIEGINYSEKDFNKKIEELKSKKTMEIKSKEIKQPETKVKTETVFHHSLSGPAVVFDDINKPDEYWVYGVQIFSEELFNAIKTFFDQNNGLDVKRFKSDSEYLVWSNSPERDTFTGIVVCVENKSFDKYVEGRLSSNKGYAQIIADDVAPIFRYTLKGDRLSSSKLWKSKKDGVFENDYERIREEISLPKTEYISSYAHNSRITIGKTTIRLFDDFNYISYTFDKKRNFISKEYFTENWKPSSEEEFLSEKDQVFKMFETRFSSEREQLSKLGFKISRLKVFRNKTFVELYEHPKTKAKVIVDNFYGKLEYKCDLNGEVFITYSLKKLEEFLQKDYNGVKFFSLFGGSRIKYKSYYSINDELFLTKSRSGYWEIAIPSLGIGSFSAVMSMDSYFKKYLISFIEDSNLNTTPEKLIEQIAENVPEFKEYLEGEKNTTTLTISAKPLFSTKTKEIAKRVAVKRISNIVASLIIQQVFSKVNKAEHQKIKDFFKTEAGIGLVKVLTAQLLPMLEQHLPEKYQHVYRTIAEEFDIQSKVDFSDGVLDLILEKVELSSPFISFNFLENLKEDSTGVRVNPLALESPNPDFQAELNAQTATKEEVSAKG